ncbi:Gp19/Gp15/Gp42 family protein [Curtobacterium flaccumfaciens]|uniref:Gp19/Gp15/Gp42 family protein n=1 Tax=Curtobacterium flaccumfaciens TaxID=2035 RepID=UPI001BDE8FBB|nr:Gp19/Gp15/Gp42 family protein [Curtobacterium flaccumfaciens]MBT1630449.1 phage Gp19/Gp15/Gp42 family protein [Curtobacterium flaccumfaciens pv. oortii]MCX2843929.1 Gp19/Gp15/Gp42 family protein [Curtobacterium flaccumfaciens pv. oortii]
MADETAWAQPSDIAAVWRPLTTAEQTRAEGLIETVSRAIRREWPDVEARLAAGTLSADDVTDVIVWTVLPILAPGVAIPLNAKSYQETSGSESRSITFSDASGTQFLEFLPWMVRVFEGGANGAKPATALPRFSSPRSQVNRAFPYLSGWER